MKLLESISKDIETFNKRGVSTSRKDLLKIRGDISVKLFKLRKLAEESKKAWKRAEFERKKAAATEEVALVGKKGVDGKALTRDDRKNKALLASEREYIRELNAEGVWEGFRTAVTGITQVLNTIASELKEHE